MAINQKSWFQRWIFDFTTYSYMFETTTDVMLLKLQDALWPFRPENQPKELNPGLAAGHRRSSSRSPNEMYGPLWVMFTLIVVLVVMSHLVKTLRTEAGYGVAEKDSADSIFIDQVVKRYGVVGSTVFDPSSVNANIALKSIMRVFFLIFGFFFVVPFAVYLTFMSSLQGAPRSYETSWKRLIQIYAYSLACFIPGSALLVILAPFNRARWVATIALTGMACFY